MPQKPILLLAFANDYYEGQHLPFLIRELEGIRELFEDKPSAPFEVKIIYSATIDKIVKAFRRPAYQGRIVAFHYGGHAGSGEIMLETIEGLKQVTEAKALADYLALQEKPPIGFFEWLFYKRAS